VYWIAIDGALLPSDASDPSDFYIYYGSHALKMPVGSTGSNFDVKWISASATWPHPHSCTVRRQLAVTGIRGKPMSYTWDQKTFSFVPSAGPDFFETAMLHGDQNCFDIAVDALRVTIGIGRRRAQMTIRDQCDPIPSREALSTFQNTLGIGLRYNARLSGDSHDVQIVANGGLSLPRKSTFKVTFKSSQSTQVWACRLTRKYNFRQQHDWVSLHWCHSTTSIGF